MKKKDILVNQPDKTETIKSEFLSYRHIVIKFYCNHTFCDHSHGRLNRFPFGSGQGPIAF
jgi:hypothetical protein